MAGRKNRPVASGLRCRTVSSQMASTNQSPYQRKFCTSAAKIAVRTRESESSAGGSAGSSARRSTIARATKESA